MVDMGADVLKVEIKTGDDSRNATKPGRERFALFQAFNRTNAVSTGFREGEEEFSSS